MPDESELAFAPATPERWGDIAAVIGACGDARHCWCAYWYLPNAAYRAGRRDGSNRDVLQNLLESGTAPGVIAYRGGRPVAWCGVGPRSAQTRLARSRILAPVDAAADDGAVWSITCFVVIKEARRQGLMKHLIEAAVDLAREQGAAIVEAYPLDLQRKAFAGELFVGTLRAFSEAGFVEVARRSPHRPIVRMVLRAAG